MRYLRSAAAIAATGLIALAAAGCDGTTPAPTASPTGSPPLPLENSRPASTTAHVGAGCGIIPARGTGSFGSMTGQRSVAAAASNPQLSVFSSAIRSAALTRQLDAMRSFTLFIPVNSAFAALSRSDISYLRRRANLVRVVRHEVVSAHVTPGQIARGGTVTALTGGRLVLGKRGTAYRVDSASVVCGNIKTANGTIYVIDRVLLPPR